MSTERRKYELRARAERQRETRARIAQAAAELHEEVGPARTTVADIARRAGVQRLTVYNHFPDDAALFPACSAHWRAQHPFPDLGSAVTRENARDRLRAVLEAVYGWYREGEPMLGKIQADRHTVPALDEFCKQGFDRQLRELADGLAAGFGLRGRPAERLRAHIALALQFWTWRSLDRSGLDDTAAAQLMADSAAALTGQADAILDTPQRA